MRIAVTGGTGFLGSELLRLLHGKGYEIQAWYRSDASKDHLHDLDTITWIQGGLEDTASIESLLSGAEMLVHAALYRPGAGFRGAEGDLYDFAQRNILGSLQLFEAAFKQGMKRTVFVSTCAVHEVILEDRLLDEAHPLWPLSHYGAHKAAIEAFVHSYGKGLGMPLCALRPTGIYGPRYPLHESKWYQLVKDIVQQRDVLVQRGGKEVYVSDVAKAIECLLTSPEEKIKGEAFNCYDRYISEYEVAHYVKTRTASSSIISGEPKSPMHQISTKKIENLGVDFGGADTLHEYLDLLIEHCS